MMVSLGDGYSTCREHGGRFTGPAAAFDHLETEHPELVDQLMRAVVVPLAEGDNPADVIAAHEPNRARRRAMRKCQP